MSKRFIDTEIFNDPWFMDLSPNAKLLFFYMITNCDHAGIIDINWKLTEFQTGIKQLTKSYDTLIKELGNRLISLKDTYFFIPKFITFQYPNFPKSNVMQQQGAIRRLKEFDLWDEENLTLNKELVNSYVSDSDNGNDSSSLNEKITKKCLMKNSGITVEDIKTAFNEAPELKNADHIYYYNTALDWSTGKNEMRTDWIATIRNFARKDIRDNKLKTNANNQRHPGRYSDVPAVDHETDRLGRR